ncbi:hypothetical protein FPV67DRAFT_926519 [Lyophyllum atratum]|nr:hypothetical protein FPV67DRAFT_926519 [Lyophyllum atratum]
MSSSKALTTDLGWTNVGLGFAFVLLDVLVSACFGLGVERSLFTAAVRCVVQLSLAAALLQKVFGTQNQWAVAGIAWTLEIVANKSKRRYKYMVRSHCSSSPLHVK